MSKPLVHRMIEATAPEVDKALRRSRRTALKGIRSSVRQLDPVGMLVHGLVASLSEAAIQHRGAERGSMKTAPAPSTADTRSPGKGEYIDAECRVIDVTPKGG